MTATKHFEATLLFKKKMNSFLHQRDENNDGYLTVTTFEQIGKKYIEYALKTKPNLDRAALSKTFNDMWVESYWKDASCQGDEALFDKKVNLKDILTNWLFVFGNPAFPETMKATLTKDAEICFDVVDTNGNGEISKKEFADYIQMHCPPAINDAELAFKALDTNHDGILSREEFADGFVDFWTNEKEGGPGEMFYGRLLEY